MSLASALCDSAEYVAQRLRAYRRPSEYELRLEYRDLMLQWARVCERRDVQELVRLSSAQPQHRQAAAGGQRASMQPTTGDQEHGSAIVGPWLSQVGDHGSSLQASDSQSGTCSKVKLFDWEVLWQLVHTGWLLAGIVVNFVPEDCVAAFSVFHFTCTLGTSSKSC